MSLHNASKYLASKGRNGDTELVHMSKGEIKGLQQLALAHGGSLSINPETGLVEAGWLKTLLPMVGGAALMMIPGMQGFGGALAASAIMGGGMYAATGSVKEGLLAGLGAFGGANLAGGLAAAGAEAGAATAAETGADVAAGTSAQVAPQSLAPTVANNATDIAGANWSNLGAAGSTTNTLGANYGLGSNLASPNLMGDAASSQLSSAYGVSPQAMQTAVANAPAITPGAVPGGVTQALGPVAPADASGLGGSFTQNVSNVGKGLPEIGKVIMDSPFKTVGAGLAPMLMGMNSNQGTASTTGSGDSNPMGLMTLSPDFKGYQPPQPNPYYEARYPDYKKKPYGMAEGGIAALADGGMDSMNPMQNPIYPQSQQEHTNFATSSQYPNSMKAAMASDYDTRTNPTTGQELPMGLAAGGVIGMASGTPRHLPSSPSMPAGGVYRDTDPNTASKGAYEAGLYRLQKANKLAGIKTAMPKAAMTSLGSVDADVNDAAGGGLMGYADGGVAVDFSGAPIMAPQQAAAATAATPAPMPMASGGITHYNLGGYSDGGRMLRGPGDGMSDSIPASIGAKQPARLADGEFVVPADVVSHLGNGSTDAGAKKLYGMMDKVRTARTGTKKQGKQIKADKYLPK